MERKFLFVIDLDGTLLSNSATSQIHPSAINAIKRAQNEGHIVTLATGRPWRSSKRAYKQAGIKTVIANYNGAHIHNPSDYSFIPIIKYMDLNDALYILGDKKIEKYISNLAIEGPGWVQLQKRNADLEKVFSFTSAEKIRIGIDTSKIPLKPTGIVFDTKKGANIRELTDYLMRRYGDLAEFSSWSKGEGLTPVFDITSVGVNKAKAISLMTRYYNIKVDNIVAIGDAYNDIPMFKCAGVSVAMANASDDIKKMTTFQTKKTNKNGGVGEFINDFLDNTNERVAYAMKIRKKWVNKKKTQTTSATK